MMHRVIAFCVFIIFLAGVVFAGQKNNLRQQVVDPTDIGARPASAADVQDMLARFGPSNRHGVKTVSPALTAALSTAPGVLTVAGLPDLDGGRVVTFALSRDMPAGGQVFFIQTTAGGGWNILRGLNFGSNPVPSGAVFTVARLNVSDFDVAQQFLVIVIAPGFGGAVITEVTPLGAARTTLGPVVDFVDEATPGGVVHGEFFPGVPAQVRVGFWLIPPADILSVTTDTIILRQLPFLLDGDYTVSVEQSGLSGSGVFRHRNRATGIGKG